MQDKRVRDQLADQLQRCAPEFGLNATQYVTFVAHRGYQRHVSAADVVHAASAILAAPADARSTARPWEHAFYRVYDALNADPTAAIISAGLDAAIAQHGVLLRQTAALADGKAEVGKTQVRRYLDTVGTSHLVPSVPVTSVCSSWTLLVLAALLPLYLSLPSVLLGHCWH